MKVTETENTIRFDGSNGYEHLSFTVTKDHKSHSYAGYSTNYDTYECWCDFEDSEELETFLKCALAFVQKKRRENAQ